MRARRGHPRSRAALCAALLGAVVSSLCSFVPSAGASALPLGLSLPSAGVSSPSVGLSVPSVGVSAPSVGVSVPPVTVTTPSVSVTTPSVGVSSSGVSVSTAGVTVSTPSPPVSTPVTSGGGATETPTGASPPGSSSPSGGSGGEESAPHGSAPGQSGGSSGAPGSASTSARAASLPAPTPGGAGARASAGGNPHASAPRKASGPGHARGDRRSAPGGARGGPLPGAGRRSPALASASTAGATRAAGRRSSSNPLDAIGKHIPLPIPVPDWSKPIILLLLALALWFGVRSRVAGRRARRLERQRVTLLQDVDAMQAALVPAIPARVGGLAVSVAYKPAEGPAAGGDFYDVFAPERGKVAIILGDVAGHGHAALTQAALARYTLRAYMQTGIEPRAALALAGRVLADPLAEHFATVIVGLYDTREGSLTYASAGHPPPIVHGLDTRAPLSVCASPPIGWTVATGRRQTRISLPLGAVVCFFSDGLIEARCKDELLGRERLDEILGELGTRPDAAKLLARVSSHATSTPDDMAACILVPEMSLVTAGRHIEELEVDAKQLGAGQARRFLETCELPIAEIERALDRARELAAAFGAALLRVELHTRGATVEVDAAGAPGQAARMARGSQAPVGT
ncbi:MAG TPA: SpoIIE family protein phosphatase [Solirubrobacteraceae bacterium]|nr:SpoIIE family protein phosphatase [Solirubrobacteraceae bacterium]